MASNVKQTLLQFFHYTFPLWSDSSEKISFILQSVGKVVPWCVFIRGLQW